MYFQIYEWISQWSGPLLKVLGAVLLANICICLQMQKRELHGQLITCEQNSVKLQSQLSTCDQNAVELHVRELHGKACEQNSVELKGQLFTCKQNYEEFRDTYINDSNWLKNQINSCKQDYDRVLDDANKYKEELSKLDHETVSQLNKSLEKCEHNYALLSTQIHIIYDKQSKLIESVDSQIEQMDVCNLKLKEYCDLQSKVKSLTEFERNKLGRLLEYLGCDRELSEHHYQRTFNSFNVKLISLMDTKEMLIGLLIRAEFKEMEKEQEKEKYLPFTKCQFVCDLQEEEVKSGSGFFRKITEGGWNIYQRIFCT